MGGRRGGLVAAIISSLKLLRRGECSGEGGGHPLDLGEITHVAHREIRDVGHVGRKGGVTGR